MSFICHRCECGHIDLFHGRDSAAGCEMQDRCQRGDYGPPELLRTFNDGRLVEKIAKPGSRPIGYLGTPLCDCEPCVALYRELTGKAA
jgi:hypothetical protein